MNQLLIGENIYLRKARLEDTKAIFDNVWSDFQLAEMMFWPAMSDYSLAEERMIRTMNFQGDKDCYFVALKETNEAIGLAGISLEKEGIYQENGIAIAKKCQGKGYGKEVLDILLKLAFIKNDALQFDYFCCHHNIRSAALCKKFGFIYESSGIETRGYDQKDFLIDKYILKREDYFKGREND